jgi:methyltransferase
MLMVGEAVVAWRHEHALRRRGAVEPAGDVYAVMTAAYPASFVAMAIEGWWRGPAPPSIMTAGAAVFVLAKALKYWAIVSLGDRWTFRILVVRGEPLVTSGPYAFLRHPNYVAVAGEMIGAALMLGAIITGPIAVVGFGALMLRRIQIEDRALR